MPSGDLKIEIRTEGRPALGKVLEENRNIIRRIVEHEVQKVVDEIDREMLYGIAEAAPTGVIGAVQARAEEESTRPTIRVIRMKSRRRQ